MSKLSLNTAVTARNISKLSVASANIFWAAWEAVPTVGVAPFNLACRPPCVLNDDGDDALDAGRER